MDDEEKSLKSFARAFQDTFRIFTAANAAQGLELLKEHKDDLGILMTDQRMPGEKGVRLLEQARQLQPRIIRILVTAYSDMDAVIDAVNSGAIYKYVTKPWDPAQLNETLKRSLEFFLVQRERDQLLKEKMAVLHNMMIADRIVSLGMLAAGLGHHIRNALVAVKTFLDLAPSKMQEEKLQPNSLRHPEFWGEYYTNVQGQIQKIGKLLNELGAASDKPSAQFSDELRLPAVLSEVLERLKPKLDAQKLHVELDVPDSLPSLYVDRAKFPLIFQLLLQDECVSLPAGATIQIKATAESGAAEAPEIAVAIRDNGPGFPPETLQQLFNPFVPRSDSPSEYGLNLMACYFIVHHHGGSIAAESVAPSGTVFRLRLPTRPAEVRPAVADPGMFQKAMMNEKLWEKLASA